MSGEDPPNATATARQPEPPETGSPNQTTRPATSAGGSEQTTATQTQAQTQSADQQELQREAAEETTETTGPDSPPLPTRHTAQAPGPRASRFQDVLDRSLAHTLAKIGWDNFAACYPTIAAQAPATLRAVQKQMVDRLGALCKKEFTSIMQARHVVAKLNELEALVSEAERRRDEAGVAGQEPPIPPHTLPPDAVLAAHLAPHLAQQRGQLNARLQTTQAHNARLFAEVQRQRAEAADLIALLAAALDDVDAAADMLAAEGPDLARESRDVEADIAAANAAGSGGGGPGVGTGTGMTSTATPTAAAATPAGAAAGS